MATTSKDIVNAIYTALSTNATLAAYVKKFYKGYLGSSKAVFPFVSIDVAGYSTTALTMGHKGRDIREYTIIIDGVVQNIADDVSLMGETGTKGILELDEDIQAVIRPADFTGVFRDPVNISDVTFSTDTGGILRAVRITVRGKVELARLS